MIVSNTVTAALDCVALGAGAGTPTPGMSPAKAEAERTDVKAIAIRTLFIDVAPSM